MNNCENIDCEYVYKLNNGAVVSACADEKGIISITKDLFEIMVNGWNESYQKGYSDAIDECIAKINREHTHSAYHNDVYEAIMLLEQLKELKND